MRIRSALMRLLPFVFIAISVAFVYYADIARARPLEIAPAWFDSIPVWDDVWTFCPSPAECNPLPESVMECNNGPSVTDPGDCGGLACGDTKTELWTKYKVECVQVSKSKNWCDWKKIPTDRVASIGDKCLGLNPGESGGVPEEGLRPGTCSKGSYGDAIYKYCCASGSRAPSQCVAAPQNYQDPFNPTEGACPVGTYESQTPCASPPSALPPTASLSLAPSEIYNGGTTSIVWSAPRASTCLAETKTPGASPVWSGEKPPSGSEPLSVIAPRDSSSVSYALNCSNSHGSASSSSSLSIKPFSLRLSSRSELGGELSGVSIETSEGTMTTPRLLETRTIYDASFSIKAPRTVTVSGVSYSFSRWLIDEQYGREGISTSISLNASLPARSITALYAPSCSLTVKAKTPLGREIEKQGILIGTSLGGGDPTFVKTTSRSFANAFKLIAPELSSDRQFKFLRWEIDGFARETPTTTISLCSDPSTVERTAIAYFEPVIPEEGAAISVASSPEECRASVSVSIDYRDPSRRDASFEKQTTFSLLEYPSTVSLSAPATFSPNERVRCSFKEWKLSRASSAKEPELVSSSSSPTLRFQTSSSGERREILASAEYAIERRFLVCAKGAQGCSALPDFRPDDPERCRRETGTLCFKAPNQCAAAYPSGCPASSNDPSSPPGSDPSEASRASAPERVVKGGETPPPAAPPKPEANLSASCQGSYSGNPERRVVWKAEAYNAKPNDTDYSWSGDESLFGKEQSVTKRYASNGRKTASVSVKSKGQSASASCFVDVSPRENASPRVACLPVRSGMTVTWIASVSGGGERTSYGWGGSDGLTGQGPSIEKTYSTPGEKTASVTIESNGDISFASCSTAVGEASSSCGGTGIVPKQDGDFSVSFGSPNACLPRGPEGATSTPLSWSASPPSCPPNSELRGGAISCFGDGFEAKGTQGTLSVSPSCSSSYGLVCMRDEYSCVIQRNRGTRIGPSGEVIDLDDEIVVKSGRRAVSSARATVSVLEKPVIASLSAEPNAILLGKSSKLSWSASSSPDTTLSCLPIVAEGIDKTWGSLRLSDLNLAKTRSLLSSLFSLASRSALLSPSSSTTYGLLCRSSKQGDPDCFADSEPKTVKVDVFGSSVKEEIPR